jgi:glycosyltransferase involved in cell wall biosynthesis
VPRIASGTDTTGPSRRPAETPARCLQTSPKSSRTAYAVRQNEQGQGREDRAASPIGRQVLASGLGTEYRASPMQQQRFSSPIQGLQRNPAQPVARWRNGPQSGEQSQVLISVIVPVYNVEQYLTKCLDSLLNQDIRPEDYEIVIVNDGTQDRSLAIAESYEARHSNIVIHSQENGGLGTARNAGLRLARGRYILFVDSDDYVASGMFGYMAGLMERHDLQVLSFSYLSQPPSIFTPTPRFSARPTDLDVITGPVFIAQHGCEIPVWRFMFRAEYLTEIGVHFPGDQFWEDVVFVAQAVSAADRIASIPVDVYRYVQRPGSIMTTGGEKHSRKMIADMEQVVLGLDELRQTWVEKRAPRASVEQLEALEQLYIFFIIARFIRTTLPIAPVLDDILAGFRAIGMYPLSRFPTRDYHGRVYGGLTFLFNRRRLLGPFSRGARLLYAIRRRMLAINRA